MAASLYNKTYLLPFSFSNGERFGDVTINQMPEVHIDYRFEAIYVICMCEVKDRLPEFYFKSLKVKDPLAKRKENDL
jgi:hypothetical protein